MPRSAAPVPPAPRRRFLEPTAGAFSDFHVKLDRDDGDQFLRDLNFKMPPGFTGDLRGIGYCPTRRSWPRPEHRAGPSRRAELPASSLVGTSNVAAGPGSHPFHAVGRMYLAGPLNGAPLSLVAITPALAGPYDYGNVVVRVALHVDPLTAQVTAVSDTAPADHRRHPDPDALDRGQHRSSRTSRSTRRTANRSPSPRREWRPGHGDRLQLLLPGGRTAPLSPSSRR